MWEERGLVRGLAAEMVHGESSARDLVMGGEEDSFHPEREHALDLGLGLEDQGRGREVVVEEPDVRRGELGREV